ncbi:peptidase [Propioniciclava coleopterorum]|uniref:Peptidase n=1 Tax=Propioniciclava coleopterorum TaxID=2714937 RepID=A0A6G7Y9S1_9ACTN|nr:DUF2268 domain-containing putative Zn-dependent protease [Propioniciclava coleopterorum]QIK73469.1 peptidase [Propioniciclava coleopterorum]
MAIRVLDTATATRTILQAPPADRPDLLRGMRAPLAGAYRFVPGGVDQAQIHSGGFGFPLDRDEDLSLAALETFEAADAWSRLEQGLTEASRALEAANPGLSVPDVTVLLTVGDGADPHFRDEVLGLAAFGGITGFIELTLLPTPRNLERLEALAAHELHHNVRYAPGGVVWNPVTVTVAEQVVAEGLADAFARELHGDAGYTPFALPHLDDDVLLDRVWAGLDIAGMQNLMPWVLGDASAARFGAAPVGLPTGAGYAAGNRIADAYLAVSGATAAGSVRADAQDVVNAAAASLRTA